MGPPSLLLMVLEVNRLPMEQGLARRAGSTGVVRPEGIVRADRGPVSPTVVRRAGKRPVHPARGQLGALLSAGYNNPLQSRHPRNAINVTPALGGWSSGDSA